MPLTPRNIVCDGPDVFSDVVFIGISPLQSHAEASPIYSTIDASVVVSGGYTAGDIEYDYSGSTSINQVSRIAIIDQVTGIEFGGDNFEIDRENDINSYIDVGIISVIPTGNFAALHWQELGCNGGSPPFAPPRFSLAEIITDTIEGTRTDTSTDPEEETASFVRLTLTPPYFTGTISGGDLELVVELQVEVGYTFSGSAYTESFTDKTDASGWGSPEFRDIRGTYGTTSTDSNGISYTWSITIG